MSSSDDDDDLPPILNSRPDFSNTKNKQSINDLYERSCVLIHELGIEKQVLEDAEVFSPSPNFDIIQQENNLEASEEIDQENIFLTRPHNLQYFCLKDLTLKNCGYNYKTEMSTDEEIMFELEPHELFELILTGNVCRNFLNVNSLVHFLIKTIAIHPDAAIICSSQRLVKSLVTDYEDICFTCEDIFQILFNCSANVTTSEIFKILQPHRVLSPSCKSSEPIPKYWLSNLKAVLCSLGDILKVCRIPEEDLDHIVICFLIMSVEIEPVIYEELQKCLITVLDRFFEESWPIYRLTIANRLGGLPHTSFLDGQWLYVYEMVRAIPIVSLNGDQLRKYICVRILLNLTDCDNKQSAEYSEELFSLSTLGIILHSLDTNDKKFQHVVIKFLEILVNHLKFTIEEYEQLCRQLKKAQKAIERKYFEVSSDLVDLELIHARINLSNLNIKMLKPLNYKNSQLKYADSDEDMSDHETTPTHVSDIEMFEDAFDDIAPEQEYCGMSPLSNVAQKNDGVPETMEVSSDDPKKQFEDSGAFVNETEKLVENSPENEYSKTASSSNFTQKDNKVSEKTENNSEKPNCLFAASEETTGEQINKKGDIFKNCPETEYSKAAPSSNFTQKDNKVWEKKENNSEKPNCMFAASKETTNEQINEKGDILELQTLSHGPQCEESRDTTSGQQSLLKVGEEKGQMATTVSELPNTEEAISVVSSEDCLHSESQMDTTNETFPKISDFCSATNFIWNEHSYSNSPKEILTESIAVPLENNTSLSIVDNLEESPIHIDKDIGCVSLSIIENKPEEPLVKETILPQISNLLLFFKSNECLNSLNFKETNKLNTANPANPQVLGEFEGLSSEENKVIKEEVSEASTNDNLSDSSLSSITLPNQYSSSKESSSKTKDAPSSVDSNVPVYSTDICKQFPSPASLVEETPEIVPLELSVENSLQLPLNEQREKASGNSAIQITLPVYSTGICKQIPSPASSVEEAPEIVPEEQFAENVLQDKCETSDNSLYEILDEQFRNDTASPLSLLNSLDAIYCTSKKLHLSSPLLKKETSSSSMPDIVLSSLSSFPTTAKRKRSTSEQNISPASSSKKRLKFSRNTNTPTIIDVSEESITGKENDNATPLEVKDSDSTLLRYAALSTFDNYFQSSSSGPAKSRTNNSDADVIVVDSSDSEDDCQVVEVKQRGKVAPQVILLD